jgi:hypothetical protein
MRRFFYSQIIDRLSIVLHCAVAIAAVDGSTVARFERNLGLSTALCTNSGEHLTRSASCATTKSLLLCSTAGRASFGIIGETLLGVELLFSGGESEFSTTISAS